MTHLERKAAVEFVERLGLLYEDSGFPRITGRLLGLLVLADEPLDFEAIQGLLKISRGSVSTSTRFLEDRGFIERTTVSGDRRTYYTLAPDPYAFILEQRLAGLRAMCDLITTTEVGVTDNEPASEKLAQMRQFHERVASALESVTEKGAPRHVAVHG